MTAPRQPRASDAGDRRPCARTQGVAHGLRDRRPRRRTCAGANLVRAMQALRGMRRLWIGLVVVLAVSFAVLVVTYTLQHRSPLT